MSTNFVWPSGLPNKTKASHVHAYTATKVAVALLVVILLTQSWLVARSREGNSRATQLKLVAVCEQAHLPACNVSTEYISSGLERQWLQHVEEWQQSFCSSLQALENSTAVWLETNAELTSLQQQYLQADNSPAQALAQADKMNPEVFSRFKTTYDCGNGDISEQTTWIEPLSHGLRHPRALCGRGADVMDRTYLLLEHKAEHAQANTLRTTQCRDRKCQNIYFDLGATTLQAGPQEAGQGWFFDAYKRQGIEFDRFLLWEAKTLPPGEVYKNVPKADMHKYQYFNLPVSADTQDPANPVNMLKAIAQPGDFVAFKLDIDNFAVEHAILNGLTSDPEAFALVDEFFFEEHVQFSEMSAYWIGTMGPQTSLASSYATFLNLRQRGCRAHSWV